MSSDKIGTSSTNNSMDERINNYTNFINDVINHRLYIGTMTNEEANILRHMLNRIRNDTELFNSSSNFNDSLISLDFNWIAGVSSNSNDNTIVSVKLASILASLLV